MDVKSFKTLGTGLHYKGRFLVLPSNIRVGWKSLTMTNTLAYCNTEIFTQIQQFVTDP